MHPQLHHLTVTARTADLQRSARRLRIAADDAPKRRRPVFRSRREIVAVRSNLTSARGASA
jgi:hypothetical protein